MQQLQLVSPSLSCSIFFQFSRKVLELISFLVFFQWQSQLFFWFTFFLTIIRFSHLADIRCYVCTQIPIEMWAWVVYILFVRMVKFKLLAQFPKLSFLLVNSFWAYLLHSLIIWLILMYIWFDMNSPDGVVLCCYRKRFSFFLKVSLSQPCPSFLVCGFDCLSLKIFVHLFFLAEQEQDDRLEHTYSSSVRIHDVALENWKAMNDREKLRERVRDIRASGTTWWWWWWWWWWWYFIFVDDCDVCILLFAVISLFPHIFINSSGHIEASTPTRGLLSLFSPSFLVTYSLSTSSLGCQT